jgi:hypothetical protein
MAPDIKKIPVEKQLDRNQRSSMMNKVYPKDAHLQLPDFLKPRVLTAAEQFLAASNQTDKIIKYTNQTAAIDSLSSATDQKVLFQVMMSIQTPAPTQNAKVFSIPPNRLQPKSINQHVQLLDSNSYIDPEHTSSLFKTTNSGLETLAKIKSFDLSKLAKDLDPKLSKTITDIVTINGSKVSELNKIALTDKILDKLSQTEIASLWNYIDNKPKLLNAQIFPYKPEN